MKYFWGGKKDRPKNKSALVWLFFDGYPVTPFDLEDMDVLDAIPNIIEAGARHAFKISEGSEI
ncbi:MAG: hypothetical protein QGG48_10420, partial [Desulfatiglandales bacterium]|nr:hypothetical protein [Desulfatiglandales bacterium]